MSSHHIFLARNPHLATQGSDQLYHLGINIPDTSDTSEIEELFGDVKFVCMGGTASRMLALAEHLLTLLEVKEEDKDLKDYGAAGNRYSIYKVGPVLCCSHGIGIASMSVLLHEIIKLVMYAKCVDPIFIRVGTSGGLGVKPGTIVVSRDAYNGLLRNEHEIIILGERVRRPAKFDRFVVKEIQECSDEDDKFEIIIGNTLAADCFYEGQGRLDGACCHYALVHKMRYLRRAYQEFGIRNIEMESTMFSALTLHIGIRAVTVCVTVIDRLQGDQVTLKPGMKEEFEKSVLTVISRYIMQTLKKSIPEKSVPITNVEINDI